MEDAIRYAKKYYFWPVSLIMLVLSLYFWSTSTAALDKQFDSNESSYKQSKTSVDGIPANPPNEKYIQKINSATKNLKKNVVEAWEVLHQQQVAHDEWPEISGVDFTASQIPQAGREQYKYRIVENFTKLTEELHLVAERDKMGVNIDEELAQKANADNTGNSENAENATEDGTTTTAKAKKELVIWSNSDVEALKGNYFSWKGIPTTLQIHVAQEDFWIFKSLFDSIKILNDGVETRNAANLREIRSILITQEASEKFAQRREKGFFDESTFVKAGEEESSESGGMADAAGAGTTDGTTATDSTSEEGTEMPSGFRDLYNERYVDLQGFPVTAEQYYAVKDTADTRSIPVYLSLVIKQEALSDLLASLTNAEKPMNIKLLLINPGKGWTPSFDFSRFESKSADSNSGDATATDTGRSAGRPSIRGRGRNDHTNNAGHNSNGKDELELDEILVDIYGIITLYNPVAESRFPQSENEAEEAENIEEQPSADEESTESEDTSEDKANVDNTEDTSETKEAVPEEKSVDDKDDTEDAPAEDAPAEDAPAEDAPAEDAPANDA